MARLCVCEASLLQSTKECLLRRRARTQGRLWWNQGCFAGWVMATKERWRCWITRRLPSRGLDPEFVRLCRSDSRFECPSTIIRTCTVGFFIHRRQSSSPVRVYIGLFVNRVPLEICRQLAQRSIINVLCGGAADIERHGTLGRLLAGSNRCTATPEAVEPLAVLP